MEKTYKYEWYSEGEYKGLLPQPINEFSHRLEINSAGSQIELELPISFDMEELTLDTDLLIDENGNFIVDENSDNIIVDQQYNFGNIPTLNDRIHVYEYSDDYPNGKKMFEGLVSRLIGVYGEELVRVTVLSYGVQLDNFIVQVLPETVLVQNEYENIDSSEILYSPFKTPQNRITAVGQTFQLAGDSSVLKVQVTLGNPGTMSVPMTLSIVQGDPTNPGSTLGTINRNIPPQEDTPTDFQFSNEIDLLGSTEYHFRLENNSFGTSETNTISVGVDTNNNYAGGQKYDFNDSTGWSAATGEDIAFQVITSSGSIGNQFLSYDPSDIVRELLDTFIGVGGELTYDDNSIANTNSTVSYTFKFNTYLEALKKSVELAPAEWYWYANPRDNTVYFDKKRTSVDHRIIKGKHINTLTLEYSLEDVVNKVYFSGGDTGSGTNLLTFNENDVSRANYGDWLRTPSDNRVTTEATANTISQSTINQFSEPQFQVELAVPAKNYDITLFQIGENVGFANFNDLVNSLILQIHSIDYSPDLAVLQLEVLPPTQSKRIEDINRNLKSQQTENNPDDV